MGLKEIYTIGISLGTNVMGIAVLQGKSLIYWQTKTIKGIWGNNKLNKCLIGIDRVLRKFDIDQCAIKSIDSKHESCGYQELLSEMLLKFSDLNILVERYSINELKQFCESKTKCSKEVIKDFLVKVYPEWSNTKYSNSYYHKVQEAILSAYKMISSK